jgi:hypothetical protein
LQTAGGLTVGITGLAFHPTTGVLYGATINSGNLRAHLVTIDTSTAIVTDVGAFSTASTLSDISFAANGALFGWEAAGSHRLQSVNVATGATTPIGTNSTGIFGGGGLAVDANGDIYITPDGTSNPSTLKTVDDTTGNFLTSINLSGHPLANRNIAGLDFDSFGVLFGTNLDGGSNASRLGHHQYRDGCHHRYRGATPQHRRDRLPASGSARAGEPLGCHCGFSRRRLRMVDPPQIVVIDTYAKDHNAVLV